MRIPANRRASPKPVRTTSKFSRWRAPGMPLQSTLQMARARPRSDGSPPHAQRLSLDAVEERRGTHDRDRRASARRRARRVRLEGEHRRRRADGPFSRFPGIDRTIVLLGRRGNASARDWDESQRRQRAIRSSRRASSRTISAATMPIDCTLLAGPCRDFNAMFRRGRARGRVAVVRGFGDAIRAGAVPRCRTRRKGRTSAWFRVMAAHRLDEGHALLVAATDVRCDDVPIVVRPLAATPWRSSSASIADETLRRRRADAARLVARRRDRDRRSTERSSGSKRRRSPEAPSAWRVRSCRGCPTSIRTPSSARSPGAPGARARTATASGRGGRRCTHSSIASTPTRSRRSPRKPMSRC